MWPALREGYFGVLVLTCDMHLIAGRFLASAYLSLEVNPENGIKLQYAWKGKHPDVYLHRNNANRFFSG